MAGEKPCVSIPLPIKGLNLGLPVATVPAEYSSSMHNVRPVDVLEGRIRLGQRPGLKKWTATQIGGVENPVCDIISVSTVS
jgi:hypothetical protein